MSVSQSEMKRCDLASAGFVRVSIVCRKQTTTGDTQPSGCWADNDISETSVRINGAIHLFGLFASGKGGHLNLRLTFIVSWLTVTECEVFEGDPTACLLQKA